MATLYVSKTAGLDTNPGTQAQPFNTIAKANAVAVNGDTVMVESGTYNEGVYPTKSDLSYIGFGPTKPVIQGDAVANTIGFYISNTGIFRVRVDGFEITGQGERGVSFQSGKGINSGHVITNNHIHHVGTAGGIAAYGCYITYGSNTVTNNEVHHIGVESMNESSGIWFGYNHDYVCSGNTVYMVRKEGMRDYFGLRPTFKNNRVFLCWTGIAHNKSMSPLTANNYVYHCLAGLNPKHTNETYEFWGLTGTPGNPGPGIEKARYWHNTVYRSSDNHLWLAVNIDPGVGATTGYMWDVDVRNNIFHGLAGSHIADNPGARQGPQIIDYNIWTPIQTFLAPPDLAPDTPVFHYRTGFSFGAAGSTKTFAQVQTDLGWNVHSIEADPQLNDPASGDLDYGAGSPAAAGGTTLPSAWGNQMGARGLGTANTSFSMAHPATWISGKSAETSTNRGRRVADELQPVYFQTSSTANEWVVLDFGSVKSFNVAIYDPWTHGSQNNIHGYSFEVSNDNVSWTTAKAGTNPDSGGASYKYQFASTQTCRYVRFTAVDSFGGNVIFGDLRFGVLTRAGDPTGPPTNTDTTAPTVALTAPANGASVSGDITITATASDNVGVVKVEFTAGGVLLATDTASPYSVTWTTTSNDAGSKTITAKAYDAAGNTATSTRTITVTTPPPPPPVTGGAYWGIRAA